MILTAPRSERIATLFDKPRSLLLEHMRAVILSEINAQTILLRLYADKHANHIIVGRRVHEADLLIEQFEQFRTRAESVRYLVDMRQLRRDLQDFLIRQGDVLQTVFMMMTLIHGYGS